MVFDKSSRVQRISLSHFPLLYAGIGWLHSFSSIFIHSGTLKVIRNIILFSDFGQESTRPKETTMKSVVWFGEGGSSHFQILIAISIHSFGILPSYLRLDQSNWQRIVNKSQLWFVCGLCKEELPRTPLTRKIWFWWYIYIYMNIYEHIRT